MSEADPRQIAVDPSRAPARRSDAATRLAGLAIDVVLFNIAILGGQEVLPAHLLSFAAGTLVNYFLIIRPDLRGRGRGSSASLHASLLVTSLAALFVRGGLLGLLVQWQWPVQLAIVPAALAGATVSLGTRDLLLLPITRSRAELIRRLTVVALAYAFVVRLLCMAKVELLPEEAYYWNYWQHLDIGYLDHPPMVAWLIGLGTQLFGDTEMGVRVGALLAQAVASAFAYQLTRNLFGVTSALVALLLMQILPYFFASGLLMTPDAPLLAAWAGCLCFLERALLAGRARAWWGVGVCLGVGLVSKYTIGLLIPAILLFMLLDRAARRSLLRWQPYAAVLVAVAIFSPVILWNAHHDWASFAFQTSRRLTSPVRFSLPRLIESVLLLLTPTGFATLPVVLWGGKAADEPAVRALRFLRVFVLVPLAFFVLFSLRHDVKLDWTGALWLAAVPGMASWIAAEGRQSRVRGIIHAAWLPTGVATLLLYGGVLHYLAMGLPGLGYSTHLELIPVGWRELGMAVNELAAEIQRDQGSVPLVVGMDRYRLASELAFYAPDRGVSVPETASEHLFGKAGLMYEQWFPVENLRGRTLLLVAWDTRSLGPELLEPCVARLQPIKPLDLWREGHFIRHLYYRVAYGYQPLERPRSTHAARPPGVLP